MLSKFKKAILSLFIPVILFTVIACPGILVDNIVITLGANGAVTGAVVTFSCFSPVVNDIVTYKWFFGDGDTAEGQTATHSYSSGGDFVVECHVVRIDDILIFTKTITVVPAGCVRASDSCTLYGIEDGDSSDGNLYTVNPLTGASQLAVLMTSASGNGVGGNGMATHPLTNELWVIMSFSGLNGRQLAKVDPPTGSATIIGEVTQRIASFAIDNQGIFYGVSGDGGPPADREKLFRIDPKTAVATELCALGNGDDGEAIAFNPFDGHLYHGSGRITQVFERIDDTSGSTCVVTNIPLSASIEEFRALTFNPATGTFLHTTGSVFHSIALDGTVTVLGNVNIDVQKGLAFIKN